MAITLNLKLFVIIGGRSFPSNPLLINTVHRHQRALDSYKPVDGYPRMAKAGEQHTNHSH